LRLRRKPNFRIFLVALPSHFLKNAHEFRHETPKFLTGVITKKLRLPLKGKIGAERFGKIAEVAESSVENPSPMAGFSIIGFSE